MADTTFKVGETYQTRDGRDALIVSTNAQHDLDMADADSGNRLAGQTLAVFLDDRLEYYFPCGGYYDKAGTADPLNSSMDLVAPAPKTKTVERTIELLDENRVFVGGLDLGDGAGRSLGQKMAVRLTYDIETLEILSGEIFER